MAFSGAGSGTPADPYQVATAAQLAEIDDSAENRAAHYIQTQDITGVTAGVSGTFSGTYNGQGYGIDVALTTSLFYELGGVLSKMSLTGTISSGVNIAGGFARTIVAATANRIVNCKSSVVMTSTEGEIAGIVVSLLDGPSVQKCLFVGTLDSSESDGYGITLDVNPVVTTSYFDSTLNPYALDVALYGLTTAELRGDATLPAGFDPLIWTKDATPGDEYPYSYPRLVKEDERNFVMSDTLNTETNRVTGYGGSNRVTIPTATVIRGGTGTDGSTGVPCKEAYLQAPFGNTGFARVTIGVACTSVTGIVVPNTASIPGTAGSAPLVIPINDLANLYFYGTAADVIDILYRR